MSFQETLIITKNSPARSLRMLILVLGVIYGVYICSLCLNQANHHHHLHKPTTSLINRQLNIPKPTSYNRSGSGCNPTRFFAIVSMQRSGSRWLETMLNNHTNVSSNGEIFYGEERRSNVSTILSTLDSVYNLEWMAKNHCCSAVGFKWMLNQGLEEYHNEIEEYFIRRGVYVIFMFRKNVLRRLISLLANTYDTYAKPLNGTHKAHVQSHQEAAILSRYKPEINSTSLIMELKLMDKMMHQALHYFNKTRHIILYYEHLTKNRNKMMMDVQEFLGLPQKELLSRNVKIHKGSLSEHVKNWDEVHNILRGTSYETFLHTD